MLLSESRDLVLMLQSPVVKSDKKQAVLDAVLGGKLGELTAGYLKILVAKGREGLVVDVHHKSFTAFGHKNLEVTRGQLAQLAAEHRVQHSLFFVRLNNGALEHENQVP